MSEWKHQEYVPTFTKDKPTCVICPEPWPCAAQQLRAEARRARDVLKSAGRTSGEASVRFIANEARQILSAALGEEEG